MEMIYCLVALIVLIGLCYYMAKNFAELGEFINQGEKLTKQEKSGLKFLKSKKSIYFFVVISMFFMGASGIAFDLWQAKIFYSVCSVLLLAGFFMDVAIKLLPDLFTLSLLWVALLGAALGITSMDPSQAIIASVVLYVSFMLIDTIGETITKKVVLGGGDIKIMAAFGALFGIMQSMILLIVACVIMIVFVTVMKLAKRGHDKELPFGLGLTTAAMINIFFPAIVNGLMNYLVI